MRRLAARTLPAGVLGAFAFFFLRDLLTFRRAFLHPDFYTLYYPFRHWFTLRLAAGEYPLWNPYWGIGHVAEVWGTIPLDLYTPLEMLVGPRFAWFQLLQLVGVLGAAAWVLRRLGMAPALSVAGAILFLLSPWVSYFSLYFIHPHSFITHVLLFLFVYRWLETRQPGYLLGIAATTAVGMLGAKLDLWLVEAGHVSLLASAGAILVYGRRIGAVARAAGAGILAMALGVAANAWQLAILLPTLRQSGRAAGAGVGALLSGGLYRNIAMSLAESVLIQIAIVAALLYLALRRRDWRSGLALAAAIVVALLFLWFDKSDLPREPVADPPPAVSATGQIGTSPSSRDGTLAGFVRRAASGPVALGALLAVVTTVFGLADRNWRAIGRTSLLFLLFAYYYCRYTRGDLGEVQVLHAAPAIFQLGLAAAVWLGCRQFAASPLVRFAYLSVVVLLVTRDQGQIILAHVWGFQWVPTRDSYIADWAFVVLAIVGLDSLRPRSPASVASWGRVWHGTAPAAAFAVIIATIASTGGDLLSIHPLVGPAPSGYPYFEGIPSLRALLARLRDGPTTRVFFANDEFMEFHHVMGSSLLEGVAQVSLYSSLGSTRYRDWTIQQRLGIRPEQGWRGWSNETTAGTARRLPRVRDLGFPNSEIYKYTVINRPALDRDALALLGVRYVLRLYPVDGPYHLEGREPDTIDEAVRRLEPRRVRLVTGRVTAEASKPMYVAELSGSLPRAFVLAAPDQEAERAVRGELRPRVEGAHIVAGSARLPWYEAHIRKYGPERVEIEAAFDGAAVLVLSDLFHPFWTASVDGRPAEVFPAFSVLRGVTLEAGRHTVTFTCRVPAMRIALAITAGALVAIVIGFASTRRRSGRSGGHERD